MSSDLIDNSSDLAASNLVCINTPRGNVTSRHVDNPRVSVCCPEYLYVLCRGNVGDCLLHTLENPSGEDCFSPVLATPQRRGDPCTTGTGPRCDRTWQRMRKCRYNRPLERGMLSALHRLFRLPLYQTRTSCLPSTDGRRARIAAWIIKNG